MRIIADKIASATRNAKLSSELTLTDQIVAREGYLVAIRVLNEKSVYNTLELLSGRMSRICRGDIIVGVLGHRNALRGYCGVVPTELKCGDKLDILNLGGVLGLCTSDHPDLGKPIQGEVLGAPLYFPSFRERVGEPANILTGKVTPRDSLVESAPLIIISGTCMNAGKTRATCEIIKQLWHSGKKVAAAKLTGVSLMRDTLEMADFGALNVLNFTDAGVVTSSAKGIVEVAKGIVHTLSQSKPDCIILELGDGIMGEYGVIQLLLDKELMSFVKVHALAANDPVGAWGAVQYLRGKCPAIDVVVGPATDNVTGKNFIESQLGVRAANALREGELLGTIVREKLEGH